MGPYEPRTAFMNIKSSADQSAFSRLHFAMGFLVLSGGFYFGAIAVQILILR
jgi:hypothetical protein